MGVGGMLGLSRSSGLDPNSPPDLQPLDMQQLATLTAGLLATGYTTAMQAQSAPLLAAVCRAATSQLLAALQAQERLVARPSQASAVGQPTTPSSPPPQPRLGTLLKLGGKGASSSQRGDSSTGQHGEQQAGTQDAAAAAAVTQLCAALCAAGAASPLLLDTAAALLAPRVHLLGPQVRVAGLLLHACFLHGMPYPHALSPKEVLPPLATISKPLRALYSEVGSQCYGIHDWS